jgi:hypothetical protein
LYGGSFPEHRILSMPQCQRWLAESIYLPELTRDALHGLDGLLVPEGSHHLKLEAASSLICKFLERGRTVCIFGDQPISWLPGLDWEFRTANRPEPGDLIVQNRFSSFHGHLEVDDIWHHHGVFHPPSGAETLVAAADGAAVLYLDRVSTHGTLLVTSLDLLRHVTSNPVSARFLDRLLPWIVEELV